MHKTMILSNINIVLPSDKEHTILIESRHWEGLGFAKPPVVEMDGYI